MTWRTWRPKEKCQLKKNNQVYWHFTSACVCNRQLWTTEWVTNSWLRGHMETVRDKASLWCVFTSFRKQLKIVAKQLKKKDKGGKKNTHSLYECKIYIYIYIWEKKLHRRPYVSRRGRKTPFPTMHCGSATNVFLGCQLIQQPLEMHKNRSEWGVGETWRQPGQLYILVYAPWKCQLHLYVNGFSFLSFFLNVNLSWWR